MACRPTSCILDFSIRTNTLDHNSDLSIGKRNNRGQTRHITLPQQPPLRMLRQLTGDTVHDTPIVEDDQISFLPSMCIHGGRRVSAPLQVPANIPDFCKVGGRGHLARGGIACMQYLHAAARDLQAWLSGFEAAPNHLEGFVQHGMTTFFEAIGMTYGEGVYFLSFKGRKIALRFLTANACDA